MAIVKIGVMTDPPEAGDYTRLISHLNAYARSVSGNQFVLTDDAPPKLALGAYLQHGGVVYQVQSAAEAISGSPGDGSLYVKIEADGDVLVASWITDISGYSWSAVYNYLVAGDESQVLPYVVVKASAVYTKYRLEKQGLSIGGNLVVIGDATIGGTLGVTGALSALTIETGHGANELYAMNQDVETTDDVIFNSVAISGGKASAHYTGSTEAETNLPVGSVIIVFNSTSGDIKLNATIAPRIIDSGSYKSYTYYASGTGTSLSGTWKSRGRIVDINGDTLNYFFLAQRIS